MALNGNEGTMISRTAAQALIANYENSGAFAANNSISGILFGKNHIDTLLSQTGCIGIRIYYGKTGTSNSDAPELILVGTDSAGDDIITNILDAGNPCPHLCSTNKL